LALDLEGIVRSLSLGHEAFKALWRWLVPKFEYFFLSLDPLLKLALWLDVCGRIIRGW
jgi:hypothetical protein